MKRSKGSQPPARRIDSSTRACKALVKLVASVVTPGLSPNERFAPPAHRAGHRLRQAAGPRGRAGAGGRGLAGGRAFPRLGRGRGADRGRLPAAGAPPARWSRASRPTWTTKPRSRALLPRVVAALRRRRCRRQQCLDVRARQRRELRLRGPAGTHANQHRRAGPAGAGLARACLPDGAGRRRRGREPAGPEAVEPESRFPELHPVQGGAGSGQHHAGASPWRRSCAWWAWRRA